MEIQAASRSEKAALGQGYDTRKEEFVGRCVRGEVEFAGNQEARLSFDRSMDQSSMSRELGVEVGGKVRYGLFSGSLAMQFANSSSSSEFSDVTIYSHTITLKNAKLRFPDSLETGLTAEGRTARGAREGNLLGENWGLTCGDEFVSQITLGAKLFVSIKVEFATREEKNSFGMQFSFQGPPVEVEANIKSAAQRFGKRASVSIQAYQLGGDVRRLSTLFGASQEGPPPILTASLENPKAVLDALAAAVRYSANDFPAQVDPNLPIDSPVGPAQLSYITSPWHELGLFSPPALIQDGVQEARRTLSAAFERHAANQRRLSQMLYGPIRLSPRQQQRCRAMQAVMSNNLALIQEAALVAYSDLLQAVSKVNEVLPKLRDFPREDFEIVPESFAQWWDMRNLPSTLRTDKEVIDEIAERIILQFNNFDQIPKEDQGLALQREIEKIDSAGFFAFDRHWMNSPVFSVFAEAKIPSIILPEEETTLRLARHLPHLRELAVHSAKQVRSLEGVEGCTELQELNVSGPVASLEPLKPLKKLRELSIMFNGGALRGDISVLRELPALREVNLWEAGVSVVDSLAQLPLEQLGLNHNPLRTVAPLATMQTLRGFWFGMGPDPVPDITAFADHLHLKNLFFAANEIVVQLEDGPRQVWTRRGQSSHFDVEETSANGGGKRFIARVLGAGLGGLSDHPSVACNVGDGDDNRSFAADLNGEADRLSGKWNGPNHTRGEWKAAKGGN